MLNEKHFTKDAYEDNGRFQIHPLSSEGLEAYLSKDSYNYHYLKSKYDPAFLKQIHDEVNAEKNKKENPNIESKEQEKKEKIEEPKEIKAENNTKENITKPQMKNKQIKQSHKPFGYKQANKGNKGNNNIKSINPSLKSSQKINNIGQSVNPVIINVKNDRGKLEEYQQPYHA